MIWSEPPFDEFRLVSVPILLVSSVHQFMKLFGTPHWSLIEFHQASTHFPIGLLLSASLFDFGGMVARKKAWHDVAFWIQMLGTGALLITLAAGYFGNPYVSASDIGQKATWHQSFAFVTTGLFLLLATWRIVRLRKMNRGESGIYALVTLMAVTIISVTGWLGSQIGN